jgi:CRP/FNR family transcriptional regulator, dissimilatory nitrate respiration regulator
MNHNAGFQVDVKKLVASLPLFNGLDIQAIEGIVASSRNCRLDRNQILFQKGDTPHCLYVVVYGQVKLALPAANGNEKVVEILGPRECVGEYVLLANLIYPVMAQAVSDTLLLQVSKEAIFDTLDKYPVFARRLLDCLARRTQSLIMDVETYTQQTGAQRVVSFIAQQCNEDMNDGIISMTLPAPKQVIASRLNLTPETLSRIFNELSAANIIEVKGKKITVNDIQRLRDLSCAKDGPIDGIRHPL